MVRAFWRNAGHPKCKVKWNVQMKRWHETPRIRTWADVMCPRLMWSTPSMSKVLPKQIVYRAVFPNEIKPLKGVFNDYELTNMIKESALNDVIPTNSIRRVSASFNVNISVSDYHTQQPTDYSPRSACNEILYIIYKHLIHQVSYMMLRMPGPTYVMMIKYHKMLINNINYIANLMF